jgi:hypothetical protein
MVFAMKDPPVGYPLARDSKELVELVTRVVHEVDLQP